jgi:signal transduction histidine kinase/DNA-binding response OmpR family regulator
MLRVFQKRLAVQIAPNRRHTKSNTSIFKTSLFKQTSKPDTLTEKANAPTCSIRHQLSATMLGLVVGLVLILSASTLVLQASYLEKELDKRITLLRAHTIEIGLKLSTELAQSLDNDLAQLEVSRMTQTVQNVTQKQAALNYAIVTNTEGVVLVHTSQPYLQQTLLDDEASHFALERLHVSHREYPAEKIIEIIHPLQVNSQKSGVLRLGFSSQALQDEIAHSQTEIAQFTYRLMVITIIITCFFMMFAYLKAWNVAKSVSYPLMRINDSVKELTQGNFSAALQKLEVNLNHTSQQGNSKDHISELTESFIEMTHDFRLEQQRQLEYIASLEDALKERGIELQHANEKLTEQGQMKASFLSAVSHELRSPLLSVMGLARILKASFEDTVCPALSAVNEPQLQRAIDHIKDHAQTIADESQQLTALINDVLDLAKMEADCSDWNIRELSIEEVIDRAMTATAPLFLDKPIQFHKHIAENLPRIEGDRERLVKVVVNLISNAAKFTEQGSVTCSAILQHDALIIAVTDTGCGMNTDEQEKVFEKFKHVGGMLTGKQHSTGLGLPICKQIITHHGGKLWLESRLDHGSAFLFSLPLPHTSPVNSTLQSKRVNEISFVWQSSWQVLENALRSRLEQPDLAQTPTVLIIDAELDNWQWLKPNCQVQHLRLTGIGHIATELLKIGIEPPDVIIVDDKFPHLDGLAVTAQLRSNPSILNVPIILHSKQDNKVLAELLGLDQFLAKPAHHADLLQAIQALFHAPKPEKRVLVFDTDLDRRHIWLALLSCCGYDVKEAGTAEHAIELAVAFTPHLVITDAELAADCDLVYRLRIELGLDKLFITLLDNSDA